MSIEKKPYLALISPLVILGLLYLTARLIRVIPGPWVWVIFILVYWLLLFGAIMLLSGPRVFLEIFKKPEGKSYWSILAIVLSLGGISLVIKNIEYYKVIPFVISGVFFSLINPILEEVFWRKVLIDNVQGKWLIYILYFNLLFSLMHYFTLGLISSPNQELIILPITFAAGFLWSTVYYKTKSIKYVIIGHLIMDLCGFTALFIR